MNDVLPCRAFLGALAIIFGFLAFLRYIRYKETLMLAEKGLSRPERNSGNGLLRWGVVVTGLGVALTVGLYFVGRYASPTYPLHLGPWMLGGLVPLFLGLILILSHFLLQKD